MKPLRIYAMFLAIVLLSGCAITHDFKAAQGIDDAKMINIIKNPETREGFLDVMTAWLSENGYKYNILPSDANRNQQGWILTYTGRWSWDVTIYLAKALIEAYNDGSRLGYATYSVSGNSSNFNLKKFEKAETTIRKMMSNLFGR